MFNGSSSKVFDRSRLLLKKTEAVKTALKKTVMAFISIPSQSAKL